MDCRTEADGTCIDSKHTLQLTNSSISDYYRKTSSPCVMVCMGYARANDSSEAACLISTIHFV